MNFPKLRSIEDALKDPGEYQETYCEPLKNFCPYYIVVDDNAERIRVNEKIRIIPIGKEIPQIYQVPKKHQKAAN